MKKAARSILRIPAATAFLAAVTLCAGLLLYRGIPHQAVPEYGVPQALQMREAVSVTDVALRIRTYPGTHPTWRDLCRQYGLGFAVCNSSLARYNRQREQSEGLQTLDSQVPAGADLTIVMGK